MPRVLMLTVHEYVYQGAGKKQQIGPFASDVFPVLPQHEEQHDEGQHDTGPYPEPGRAVASVRVITARGRNCIHREILVCGR